MTNIGDVIRQIEAVMSDIYYPPTSRECEVCARILSVVSGSATDPRGSH